MAYWDKTNGWQVYSLPTNAKTDYKGTDFIGDYPAITDKDVSKTYNLWVKVENGAAVNSSTSPQSGTGWNQYTLTDKGGGAGDQIPGVTLNPQFIKDVEGVIKNLQQQVVKEVDSYNNSMNTLRQQAADALNTQGSNLNNKNKGINNWSAAAKNKLSAAKDGTYKTTLTSLDTSALDDLKNQGLLSNEEYKNLVDTAVNSFDSDYLTNKLVKWDALTQGAQPPTGGFDPEYYRLNTAGGTEALKQWNDAQTAVAVGGKTVPDLDVVGRYNRDSYLHWYYTTQGKAAGDRGNPAQAAGITENYKELLTDADYQQYRDNVLGLADRFDNIKDWAAAQDPETLKEWYSSLPSDQRREYDSGTLAVPTLDYIPDRLRDKIKMTKGTTYLEGSLAGVLGEKEKQQQQVFGSLTSDSLRKAANELQIAKQKEQAFDVYTRLPGLSEIVNVNESLANSLLGDSGIGGVLGWMQDPEDVQKGLESSLSKATGIPSRSNAVYNWQKWFDDELVKGYEGGITVTDPLDPTKTYTVDAEFAKDYIDRYLKPRFDTSRSMSEFISYMDIKQNEQNVFQTQSALDSLRDIADVRAKAYLDGIKSTAPLNFNADFYWDPKGNFTEDDPKLARYTAQKDEVSKDWEEAKTRGSTALVPGTDKTWDQWAYYYGLDINDKTQFAKLHYQIKGAANGFDPAKDLITLKDADDYIQNKILPEIADEKLKIGDISFLNFVTPEEFADRLLEGIDPATHKEEWDKLLETLGLSGKDMGIEEVKEYIIDFFRTGAAKEIRESIKYLNEKKITPSQEELGVEYIERPEDVKPTTSPYETDLYKVFKNAGYQGSEDDFYTQFMPDVDRGEMELLSKSGKGLELGGTYAGLTSKDPFEALASMETLFSSADSTTTKKEETAPSYFKLFEDETKDEDYKSKSGQKILGEFTSLFKGFT